MLKFRKTEEKPRFYVKNDKNIKSYDYMVKYILLLPVLAVYENYHTYVPVFVYIFK